MWAGATCPLGGLLTSFMMTAEGDVAALLCLAFQGRGLTWRELQEPASLSGQPASRWVLMASWWAAGSAIRPTPAAPPGPLAARAPLLPPHQPPMGWSLGKGRPLFWGRQLHGRRGPDGSTGAGLARGLRPPGSTVLTGDVERRGLGCPHFSPRAGHVDLRVSPPLLKCQRLF